MSRCAKCDQEVTAGYVLCRRCYERMEGIKEAAIMQEEYQHLVERLRNRSLYKDKATLEIMDLCMEAATVITDLLARTEAAEARAEKAERKRDAAIKDMKQNTKCYICKHYPEDNVIAHCKLFRECGLAYANWEWRGLKEE